MRQTPSIVPHLQRVEAGILFLTFTGPLRKQTQPFSNVSATMTTISSIGEPEMHFLFECSPYPASCLTASGASCSPATRCTPASPPLRSLPAPALPHHPRLRNCQRTEVPSGKLKGMPIQSCWSLGSDARDLPRRVFGRTGPACSASSRRRDRDCGFRAALLSLVNSELVGPVERHRA